MKTLTHEPVTFPEAECYEAAFKTLQAKVWDGKTLKPTDWRLVHGILNDHNGAFGHAWLENGDTVYDPLRRKYLPKALYYESNRINYTVQYTFPRAFKLKDQFNTYGSWDQKIATAQHLPRLSMNYTRAHVEGEMNHLIKQGYTRPQALYRIRTAAAVGQRRARKMIEEIKALAGPKPSDGHKTQLAAWENMLSMETDRGLFANEIAKEDAKKQK